jgi:hypothetical protein
MCVHLTVGFCLKIYISLIPDPHHRITKQRYQPLDPCSDHSHPSTGRHGHVASAFALVEQCPDFSSLASLCRKEAAYPPDDNPCALRIQVHSDRFKDEFAVELYRWYVQHSLLHYCLPFNGSRLKMSLFFFFFLVQQFITRCSIAVHGKPYKLSTAYGHI